MLASLVLYSTIEGLLLYAPAALAAIVLGRRMCWPLLAAARSRRAPLTVFVSDLIAVAVLIQVAIGAYLAWRGGDSKHIYYRDTWWLAMMTFAVGSAIAGAGCVQTLARAGVASRWRRFAFILLAPPMVVAFVFPLLLLFPFRLLRFFVLFYQRIVALMLPPAHDYPRSSDEAAVFGWPLALVLAIPLAALLTRRLCLWVVSPDMAPTASREPPSQPTEP